MTVVIEYGKKIIYKLKAPHKEVFFIVYFDIYNRKKKR